MTGNSGVIVVGGGVIGLTTAVTLIERGDRVALWTRDPIARTTSAAAGALFWPYRIQPAERVARWMERSLACYERLAHRPEETGVRIVAGLMTDTPLDGLGGWASLVPTLREARADELPDGCVQGLRAAVPLIDMPTYLRYLKKRLRTAGVDVVTRDVTDLAEPASEAPVVVDCTGLGARALVPDASVRPVRGQVVLVEDPGIDEWFVAGVPGSTDMTYVMPGPCGVLLGGSATEHSWDLRADTAEASTVIARCARFYPALAQARILEYRVGLRPARPQVRLEAVRLPGGGRLVHNYGHGGAGVTVAWGCAQEAALLATG